MTADGVQCQLVTYGLANDDCYPATNLTCASGLICDVPTKTCQPVIGESAPCDPARSLCDTRLGLACLDNDADGNFECAGIDFVNVGAQCGTFTEDGETVTRLCSTYALCTGGPPTVCELRRRLDETCTTSPDNCFPGLVCEGGVCVEPTLTCD
jgi:hypothetical protein